MGFRQTKPSTADQEALIKGILNARARADELGKAHKQAVTQLNARVARALRLKIPAALIAERLGLAVQRIYQMRDNTR